VGGWEELNRFAFRHGVRPLVLHTLKETCATALDPAHLAFIRRHLHVVAAHNKLQVGRLKELLERFAYHEIPALVIKGPALNCRAYGGDMALRLSGDLDLLIPPAAFQEAESVLLRNDFEPVDRAARLNGVSKTLARWSKGQCPYRHADGSMVIDLHTRLIPPGYYYPFSFRELWERADVISVGEHTFPTFAPEDALLLLAFQGAKNKWNALKYVRDLVGLMQADINWTSVMARAQKAQSVTLLLLGLALGRELYDMPLPAAVNHEIAHHGKMSRLLKIASGGLRTRDFSKPDSVGDRIAFQFLIQEGIRPKAQYVAFAAARKIISPLIS
jgi:hypothetical protein